MGEQNSAVLRYDVHVVEAEDLVEDALRRIRHGARKHRPKANATESLVRGFLGALNSLS